MTVCLICEVAMKNLKFFSFILACIVSVFFTFPVHARDLPGIKTAWLGELTSSTLVIALSTTKYPMYSVTAPW